MKHRPVPPTFSTVSSPFPPPLSPSLRPLFFFFSCHFSLFTSLPHTSISVGPPGLFLLPSRPLPPLCTQWGEGGNQAGGGCEGSRVESICLCRGRKLNKGSAGSAGAQYEETGGGRREKGSVGYGRWSWKGRGGNLREKKTKWSFPQPLPNFGGDKEGSSFSHRLSCLLASHHYLDRKMPRRW